MVLLGSLYTNNNQTKFNAGSNKNIYIHGDLYLNSTHASSEIILGAASAPSKAGWFRLFTIGGSYYSFPTFGYACKVYNLLFNSSSYATSRNRAAVLNLSSLTIGYNINFEGYGVYGTVLGLKIDGLNCGTNYWMIQTGCDNFLITRVSASSINHNNGNNIARVDRSTFTNTTNQIGAWATTNMIKVVGCEFPYNARAQKWIPDWDTATKFAYAKLYSFFLLRVTNGTAAISGASLSLTDSLSAAAVDFDDTAITSFTSDSNGRFWRQALTIRAGSTTSIINVNETLTTDQWRGRWIWINGEIGKVVSNTNGAGTSALTLLTVLTVAPTAGMKGGIILEPKTAAATWPSGVEALVVHAPLTITLSATGYTSYSDAHPFDIPEIELEIALSPLKSYPVFGGGHIIQPARAV